MNFNKFMAGLWSLSALVGVISMTCNGIDADMCLQVGMALCLAMTNGELAILKRNKEE
jgi:hypothetical protein